VEPEDGRRDPQGKDAGAPPERGGADGARRALFVDLDGTVRFTKTGRPHPVKPWDQRIRAGVKEKLAGYRSQGHAVVAVTNQGGVAMGMLTEDDVRAIHKHLTEELLPDTFDLVLYCPYHPRGRIAEYRRDADCRKPKPGMAIAARDRLGLDLAASIMVGDTDTDEGFAQNAGIGAFHWADDFFGKDEPPPRKPRAASTRAKRPATGKRKDG
jgi:D-glycero-D-manno-heptose 1,7-bisphosphate phosphatase